MNRKSCLILLITCAIVSLLIVYGLTFAGQTNQQNIPMSAPSDSVTDSPNPELTPTPQNLTSTPLSYDEYCAEAQRLLNQAAQKISQTRNFSVPSVNLQVVTKDWSIQTWGVPTANADLAGITRQENIYKALLMIPQNASLYEATVDWAGYFMAVVQSGKIYIVQENFNITNTVDAEATMVHELTHIMQNFYNIPHYYYSFDGNKASTALTEGDATFTASYIKNQTLTVNQNKNSSSTIPSAFVINSSIPEFSPVIPDSVSRLNYFPYDYGEKFVQALYNKGGWETVNRAYKNPPNSTEQILHPEKYFNAELPASVTEIIPSEGNWTKTWSAQYGEFFIQNMLSTHLIHNDAEKAAAGWGADKLAYYVDPNDQYLITWNIKWDTFDDAGDFFIAFNNYMRNADAQETRFCQWQTNNIRQKIIWDQDSCTTLIIATTDPSAFEQFT